MNDTLLIIGGRPQALAKADELGLRVVWLQQKKPMAPGQIDPADAVIMMNYRDWDSALPLVRAAHQTYGFTRVVSLVDQAMELVGQINDELGLPGTSRAVAHRFCDKLAMREHLRSTGFEDVAAAAVTDLEGLRRFGERHGYPVVLKPTDGTASRGVIRVETPEDAEDAWRAAAALRDRADLPFAAYYPVREFLAEEYLDGTEYSVEAFSFDGRHSLISVTGKSLEGVIETGHAQPATVTADDEAAITAYVTGFLDAMGLRDGASHTELRLTSRGPRIVESHNRVVGGRVMDLIRTVYGIDLEHYTVGWPFRLVPELPTRPEANGAAAVRFLTAEPGTVVAIEGADEVRAHPDVLDLELEVEVGDVVRAVTDNFFRSGELLVTATETAAAVELAESLSRKVRIVTRGPEVGSDAAQRGHAMTGGRVRARWRSRTGGPGPEVGRIRDAVHALVESGRFDAWLTELPDEVLIHLVAPLEMLAFQYYLDPPRERHLVRAARVACEAMEDHLDACPADLAGAFRRLRAALEPVPKTARR